MPVLLNLRQTFDMEPPTGVTAHPIDSQSIRVELIVVASICLFLTTSAVAVRLFIKAVDSLRLQLEDCSIILAYACFVSFVGTLFVAARAGLGHHQWDVTQDAFKRVLVYSNISVILYAPSILFAKLAILSQLGRWFSTIRKYFVRWAIAIAMIFCVLAYSAIFFANIFICTPRAKLTDPSANGKCIPQNTLGIVSGAIDGSSSIALLLLPLYGISQLHFPVRRKFEVALGFGAGAFVCAAGGVRVFYNLRVLKASDATNAMLPFSMWSLAEIAVLVFVACCPNFPLLVDRIRPESRKRISYPQAHSQWIPTTMSKRGSPHSSKTQIFYPANSEITNSREPSIHLSQRQMSTESIAQPEQSLNTLEPTVVPFEPFERPISHLSYDSYATAAIAELLEDQTPMSPVSYTTSNCPTSPQIAHATRMSVTPVRLGSARITKTVDVRVSNHTNPGSPINFGRTEW